MLYSKRWGSEEWIVSNDHYGGKILRINAGQHTSLHYHKEKTETFYVSKGCLLAVTQRDDGPLVQHVRFRSQTMTIEPGVRHQLKADPAWGELELIEFSTPYGDNSDSHRVTTDDQTKGNV